MAQAVLLILVGMTSIGAILVGTRGLGFRPENLRPAIGKALECVGSMVVFFAANAALGLAAIVVGRSATGVFVSSYSVSDPTLLAASFLQGLIFHCWREIKSRDVAGEVSRQRARRRAGDMPEGGN